MSETEYEALERFAIMSEQSDVGGVKAIKYVQQMYGREIAIKIWKRFVTQERK